MDELTMKIKLMEQELSNQNKILSKVELAIEKQIEIIVNQETCRKKIDALEGINNKVAWIFILMVLGGLSAILSKGWA